MSAERQTAKTETRSSFGSIQVLIMMALFIALSIVLGKQLSFTAGPFRISFENLTVLMAGIFFGPLAGLTVGACADLIGACLSDTRLIRLLRQERRPWALFPDWCTRTVSVRSRS